MRTAGVEAQRQGLMTALTLRGLFARKMRAVLTGLAVLLGVAMISGTYVFTDTINSTFDKVFETANEGVDVGRQRPLGVRHRERPGQPGDPGVAREPRQEGARRGGRGRQRRGHGLDLQGERRADRRPAAPRRCCSRRRRERFDPLDYVEGEPPANPHEVAINKGTADEEGLKIGDKISLVGTHRQAGVHDLRARQVRRRRVARRRDRRRRDAARGAAARRPAGHGRLDPGGGASRA